MKTLIGMTITYKPVAQLIDFLEAHKDTYIPVVGNGTKHRDSLGEWAKQHCLTDDMYSGSISHLNSRLNEGTVLHTLLYDVLPKTDADYYGLCHYRRFFPDQAIEQFIDSGDDMLVMEAMPLGVYGVPTNVWTQYMVCHYASDFLKLRNTLMQHGEYDEDIWNKWKNASMLIAPCNLFIAKRDVFKEHSERLLKIGIDVDAQIDTTGRDNYQKRASSFILERANSYLCFKALAEGKWRIAEAKIEQHLDWKPADAKDQRGLYTNE